MQVNLLPNGNKKTNSKHDATQSVHEVPMSTPIPLDKSVVGAPVDIVHKDDAGKVKNNAQVPVARKYSTIETDKDGAKSVPPKPVRDVEAPKYVRDRSGRKEPVVFAPRRSVKLSDPVSPQEKVDISELPKAEKKSTSDKMVETKAHSLKPSAKENLLEQFKSNTPKFAGKPKPLVSNVGVPIVNKIKPAIEHKTPATKKLDSKVERQNARSGAPFLIAMLLVASLIGVGLWWGVLYWHDSATTSAERRADMIAGQVAGDSLDDGAGLRLATQLQVVEDWLKDLPQYEHIFPILEGTVLETVSYLNVDVLSTNSFILTGQAPDILTASKQYLVFKERPDIRSIKVQSTAEVGALIEFVFEVKLVD